MKNFPKRLLDFPLPFDSPISRVNTWITLPCTGGSMSNDFKYLSFFNCFFYLIDQISLVVSSGWKIDLMIEHMV